MAPLRQRSTRAFPSPSTVRPARLVAGLLLTGSARSVHALVPNAVVSSIPTASFRGAPRPLARSCVRRRGAWAMGLSAPGESEAGDIDSSELYADMRRRLEDLRRSGDDSAEDQPLDWTDDGADRWRTQRHGGGGGAGGGGEKGAASGTKAYSGQEMKKAYYEAFWRARNLHKEAKFDVGSQGDGNGSTPPSKDPASPPTTPPTAQLASRSTLLSPMGLNLVLQSRAAPASSSKAAALSTSDVQGLTQMYYLDEEAEERAQEAIAAAATAAAAPLSAAAATVVVGGVGGGGSSAGSVARGNMQREEAELLAGAGVVAFEGGRTSWDRAEPQGMTQMFFLDEEEEVAAAAALPKSAAGASFLRERLGVSGDVVQGLREVELDHARLAMLAVLLTGAVGAGAGVPSDASSFMDARHGFAALADVARTPWLDPCVAGLILTVKALSEGDWRLGKGALAAWADQALSVVSDSGAKVLRLSSGDEMRHLAVEMEVKHGRLALGAVVCAMAQQGLATVGA